LLSSHAVAILHFHIYLETLDVKNSEAPAQEQLEETQTETKQEMLKLETLDVRNSEAPSQEQLQETQPETKQEMRKPLCRVA
jgi:hypothetical protein